MYKSLDVISIINEWVVGFEERYDLNARLIELRQVFIALLVETLADDDDVDGQTRIFLSQKSGKLLRCDTRSDL